MQELTESAIFEKKSAIKVFLHCPAHLLKAMAQNFSRIIIEPQKSKKQFSSHLMMAESIMSGLLVAPMMNTFFLLPMPSISVRIWLITCEYLLLRRPQPNKLKIRNY